MAYPGARAVVLLCFLVHFVLSTDWIALQSLSISTIGLLSLVQGITLLLYPFIGLLADTCFNRHLFIKASIFLLFLNSSLVLAFSIIFCLRDDSVGLGLHISWYNATIFTICLIICIVSVGMFDAVGIQFGMDQMIEASSDQISAFIHWYYWSMNIGIGVQAIVMTSALLLMGSCAFSTESVVKFSFFYTFCFVLSLQLIVTFAALLSLYKLKKHLTIEPAGHNPFTTVYKVLRYAWQHKCPERRSAFTYWEEDIPPRIDLGKTKYGGPFTTEEVEDVKTFLMLSLLLASLFGFHLADNGYSVIQQLNYKLCPSAIVQASVSLSPNILQAVTVMVCVPTLHFVLLPRLHRCIPNMLHRLGIGSVLMFFQELAGIVIVLSSWEEYSSCNPGSVTDSGGFAPLGYCYTYRSVVSVNGTCVERQLYEYCGEGDYLFLWTLVPIMTRTIAYHLVFMTALEFLSAQAPLKMKGSLICLWYALSSLRYITQSISAQFKFLSQSEVWLIYTGVKASLMLLSILLYCCVAKCYSYRLRDDVVNERYLVEEVYDRELSLVEQYEREKKEQTRALYEAVKAQRYHAFDS